MMNLNDNQRSIVDEINSERRKLKISDIRGSQINRLFNPSTGLEYLDTMEDLMPLLDLESARDKLTKYLDKNESQTQETQRGDE